VRAAVDGDITISARQSPSFIGIDRTGHFSPERVRDRSSQEKGQHKPSKRSAVHGAMIHHFPSIAIFF